MQHAFGAVFKGSLLNILSICFWSVQSLWDPLLREESGSLQGQLYICVLNIVCQYCSSDFKALHLGVDKSLISIST